MRAIPTATETALVRVRASSRAATMVSAPPICATNSPTPDKVVFWSVLTTLIAVPLVDDEGILGVLEELLPARLPVVEVKARFDHEGNLREPSLPQTLRPRE